MIAEITLCVFCVGSFAIYIAYVASKITPNHDPVIFGNRKEQEVHKAPLIFYHCCDPWGKHK